MRARTAAWSAAPTVCRKRCRGCVRAWRSRSTGSAARAAPSSPTVIALVRRLRPRQPPEACARARPRGQRPRLVLVGGLADLPPVHDVVVGVGRSTGDRLRRRARLAVSECSSERRPRRAGQHARDVSSRRARERETRERSAPLSDRRIRSGLPIFGSATREAVGRHSALVPVRRSRNERVAFAGVQGLCTRLAIALNRLRGEHGTAPPTVITHVLRTPTEVERAPACERARTAAWSAAPAGSRRRRRFALDAYSRRATNRSSQCVGSMPNVHVAATLAAVNRSRSADIRLGAVRRRWRRRPRSQCGASVGGPRVAVAPSKRARRATASACPGRASGRGWRRCRRGGRRRRRARRRWCRRTRRWRGAR